MSLDFGLLVLSYSDNLPYAFCEQIGKEIRDISDEIPFEIPDSWEWVRFASIIELQSGQDLTPDKYNANENGLPYITGASNIENGNVIINRWTEYGRAFAFKGDILLTCKGTVGTMAILQQEQVHIARQIMGIRPYNGADTDYVKLVLETLVERLKAAAKSMIPGIARDDVLFSLIPLPPLSEQHRIVSKIEELLPYIERYGKAEEHLTTLNTTFPEALKKSILQEAVQGKLVPQNPYDEPASVLLERIRAEKQALIKAGKIKRDKHESVIVTRDKIPYEIIDGKERCIADEVPFELPESWCWCRLGDILLKLTDGTHSTPKYTESGISFISVKDVSSGKLDFSNCKHISEKEHTELYDRCNPEIGDILLTKVGTTGIPVIVDTDLPFSLFVSVALLKFNQELLYNKYLLYMINSPLVQKQAAENTKGVGNKNWVMRDIANTLIVIPPIDEQHRIVAKIEEIMPYINTITK
ncbi:restriction endonuclease subunit S [uncultured Ruminococcus sp.]|uniref:restriction endonuclease subunit S n=1 Tax=uncultured Ruminococcus sp. TaxID=165186 RepID=UPI0025E09947|nr:restriction endonuclease subunit S [uncultured Ruminococcus sp.]